ncbi:MAG: alkyldihydroxyacetonephosphate synthase [Actinomycetes bacterium]|nr:MAG: alkyldihydroxyacetonephosphate synthase [Actinomycetes bacterium]
MTPTRELLRRDAAYDRWGEPGAGEGLGPAAEAMLRERIDPGEPCVSVPLEAVDVAPATVLPDAVVAACGGEDAVSTDDEDRIRHAAGKGYPDLIRMRSGRIESAPDAVLAPPDAAHVAATLAACADAGVAVVPFGGGTSVVGGVEPERGGFERLAALDLTALRAAAVDPVSMTARLGPGLRGPEAEALLNSEGFTLGHFPQSYRYATIGGYAATRSAGQASSGYGRFDDLVTEVELTSPSGTLRTLETPHTAAGPSLRELVLGSEGVLGVITDVGVRVRPLPDRRRYEGWFAPGFGEGIDIVRDLAQGGELPDVVRLSDREETRVSLAMSGIEGIKRSGLDTYLRLRRRSDGCMLIVGWEGERDAVERRRQLTTGMLRARGAVPLGASAGESWERGRFEGPHLRDVLIDHGILVETLETAHAYARLVELYAAVGDALAGAIGSGGGRGVVMCHVSHVYRDGASLYFTFLTAARTGSEIEQWRELKGAACEAIVATGGTITHHHAVGRDHVPYMEPEVGALGLDVLRAAKERLDPAGIMNPGKLLK